MKSNDRDARPYTVIGVFDSIQFVMRTMWRLGVERQSVNASASFTVWYAPHPSNDRDAHTSTTAEPIPLSEARTPLDMAPTCGYE